MADVVTREQIAALAAQLPPVERRLLAETILRELDAATAPAAGTPGRAWMEIRGIMPYPMCGEDAQAWVSRTRQESDEHRERQLRREK